MNELKIFFNLFFSPLCNFQTELPVICWSHEAYLKLVLKHCNLLLIRFVLKTQNKQRKKYKNSPLFSSFIETENRTTHEQTRKWWRCICNSKCKLLFLSTVLQILLYINWIVYTKPFPTYFILIQIYMNHNIFYSFVFIKWIYVYI